MFGKPVARCDFSDFEHAFCHCPGFVHHDCMERGQCIKEIGAFYENAVAGRRTDASKIPKGYRYHQRARA